MKIHSSSWEIEDFVETHLCELCVILRSRVLLDRLSPVISGFTFGDLLDKPWSQVLPFSPVRFKLLGVGQKIRRMASGPLPSNQGIT